jgi:hypothetical protein
VIGSVRLALVAALLVMSSATVAAAQVTGVPPRPAPRDTAKKDTVPRAAIPAARDTSVGRDTTIRDTTLARPLVEWTSDSDSVAADLMKRPGYRATRYQGDNVIFDAQSRALQIQGNPAAVGREQTVVIGDTVLYNDSTKFVTALGDTVILHDPSQQSADVVAKGRVTYNTALGRGTASNISTSVESGERYFLSGQETAFVRDSSAAKRSS